ncbi:MAG: helix-turn-helix transcriptional regulator [Blastocatellia bacterium]|nr:helix-turn-helix transcriptional regulator [Blastocatellia bacterium]
MDNRSFKRKYELLQVLLIEARKGKSLSQVDLAKKLARPQSFVSKYEIGERRLSLIEFLEVTRAIGINPKEIIDKLEREDF